MAEIFSAVVDKHIDSTTIILWRKLKFRVRDMRVGLDWPPSNLNSEI